MSLKDRIDNHRFLTRGTDDETAVAAGITILGYRLGWVTSRSSFLDCSVLDYGKISQWHKSKIEWGKKINCFGAIG